MAVDLSDQKFVSSLFENERRKTAGGGRWILLPILVLTLAYLTPF